MTVNINKTKQAFWVGIGSLSTFIFSILITAILARYLTKEDLGTYRQVLYVYNTLVIVFSAGLPRVFAYYLPKYDLAEGKSITNKLTLILFYCGIVFSAALYLSSDLIAGVLKNDQLILGIKYFSIIPMLLLPTLGIEGIFASYQKTIYIAIYNISTKIIMLFAISIAVILYGGTYENAIIGWVISSLVALFFALFIKKIPFKNVITKKTTLVLSNVLKYSLPIVLASVSGIAIRAADQFYISRYFGSAVFAEFAIGFIQLPFVAMITGATSTILLPVFSRLNEQKNANTEMGLVWKNALIKSAYLIYPVIIFFYFYAEPMIKIIYTEKYLNSAIYFQIAMTLNFFNIIIFAPLLFAMGKTKLYAQIHLLFGFSAWIGGYIVVIMFNSPYWVAAYSVFNNALLILVCFIVTARLLEQKVFNLIPIIEITRIVILSLISVFTSIMVFKFLLVIEQNLSLIITSFILYAIILIVGANFLKINYIKILKPLFTSRFNK